MMIMTMLISFISCHARCCMYLMVESMFMSCPLVLFLLLMSFISCSCQYLVHVDHIHAEVLYLCISCLPMFVLYLGICRTCLVAVLSCSYYCCYDLDPIL